MRACLVLLMAFAALPAAARAPEDVPEAGSDRRDRIICKRFLETGSLVKGYRTCKTQWEWQRERDNVRTFGVSDSCAARADPGGMNVPSACKL